MRHDKELKTKYDFSEDELKTIREMWQNGLKGITTCVCCNECGGGYASRCECARKRFYYSMTPEAVANYQKKIELKAESVAKDMAASENLLKIAEYGTYYRPPWKHYVTQRGPTGTDVKCDKCFKIIKNCCIGYEDKDLCLKCVDLLLL